PSASALGKRNKEPESRRDGTTNCEPIATTVFTGECGFSSDLGNKSLRASVVKTILQFSNKEGSSYGNHSIGTSQDENHGRKLSARRSQTGQRLHSRRLQRRPADDRQTRGRVCGQRGPAQRREDRAQGLVGVARAVEKSGRDGPDQRRRAGRVWRLRHGQGF